jgi:hypothetical protein
VAGSRLTQSAVVLLFAGCGGAPPVGDSGHAIRPLVLHPLSPQPACWVHPPEIAIPPDTSDVIIQQTEYYLNKGLTRAFACIDMYSAMIDVIAESPELEEWYVDPQTSDSSLRVTSPFEKRIPDGALFKVELSRPPSEERDACTRSRKGMQTGYGVVTTNASEIDHDAISILWNDSAVAMTTYTGLGRLITFYRGCDPVKGISFGQVIDYDGGDNIRCWTSAGEFVACDPEATWPF